MPAVRHAATPPGALYRLGFLPEPLAWPPWQYAGTGRFDDPRREFRVLYAAAKRRTIFIESLARYRHALGALALLTQVRRSDERLPMSFVPAEWRAERGIGKLRLHPGQRWLDLRALATRERLR